MTNEQKLFIFKNKKMDFLEIEPKQTVFGGEQWKVFFPNGYGASILRNHISYGGHEGLFELAVLKGNEEKSTICYDTPITSDVLGYLEEEEVNATLQEIEKLPSVNHLPSVTEIMSEFVTNVLTNLVKE